MISCANCEFAIFDETWGDYKCKKLHRRVYDPESHKPCDAYKAGRVEISKKEYEER